MKNNNQSKTLLLFYVLVAYVVLQFVWWAYMLFQLNTVIYTDAAELKKRWLMIVGEGSVFLLLLVLGVIKIHRNIKKEYELARQQQNFMLSVTHELKTPLASIKLLLETLALRDLDKQKQISILQTGLLETERLNALVENILLSARMDNSSFALHIEKINLSEFIPATLKSSAVFNQNTDRITISIDDSILFVMADKVAVQSIILNLLENAIKYSEISSPVTIALKLVNNCVSLSVADNGVGIAEAEKNNIFQKFYRVGNELTRSVKGTGLGLYIVKNLVNQLGATVAVKNNIPKGSIFEVVFKIPPFKGVSEGRGM